MKISPVQTTSFAAKAKNEVQKDSNGNPITKRGERATLVAATFVAGLGASAKFLLRLFEDGDWAIEDIAKTSGKLVDKAKGPIENSYKRAALHVGGFVALSAAIVGVMAILYTLFKSPNIAYEGKVNAFEKGKNMDVYIKGNEAEKELYTQLNEQAKTATTEEKQELASQFMQLKTAKNELPDFLNGYIISKKA